MSSPVAQRDRPGADPPSAVVGRLRPFDVVCVMRERTPLPTEILQQLPNLKLIASTGPRNASINTQTAADLGIAVTATGYDSTPTIEFTWSLILASMRGIDREAASLKAGGWQTGLGSNLRGKSLGVVGLGNIGREVARIGLAFGMTVIAWSQNLTEEKASAAGATLVDKQTLFREADIVTVHLVLSSRTKGLIGAPEFALMKPTARLVNTSRGPIVDEAALIEALQARRIAGAAIDVFERSRCQPTTRSASWRTSSRRRTSAMSPRTSIALSTATPRPILPPGSTAGQKAPSGTIRLPCRRQPPPSSFPSEALAGSKRPRRRSCRDHR